MCVEEWSFASSDIFRTTFPGQISSSFPLCRTKATYLISDRLGPYFKNKLVEDINESGTYFTIQYDGNTTGEEANGCNCTMLITLLKRDCSAFPVSFIFQ